MLKEIVAGLSLVVIAGLPIASQTPAERPVRHNDKMLIEHNGRELCVDWWAWPGHMIQHGDTLLGSCDVPETSNLR